MCGARIEQILSGEDSTNTSDLRKDTIDPEYVSLTGMVRIMRYKKETVAVIISPEDAAILKLLKSPEFRETLTAIKAKLELH